ncbi:MAG: hypothetical protein R2698_14405 [Microthrixaceae bacterium]
MVFDPLSVASGCAAVAESVARRTVSGAAVTVRYAPWTTTVVGRGWELSIHHRMEGAPHPDVELSALLAARGCDAVLAPTEVMRRRGADLAVFHRVRRPGIAGDALARSSLTAVLRDRVAPDRHRLDLASAMGDLGRTVAAVHVDLAETMHATVASGAVLSTWMRERVAGRFDTVASDSVGSVTGRVQDADDLGGCCRIHGNLDLAHVSLGRGGWVLRGFGTGEGTPASRVERTSPLVDLATLTTHLRRIRDTGVADALAEIERSDDATPEVSGDGDTDVAGSDPRMRMRRAERRREIQRLGDAWERRCVDALIVGYTSEPDVHTLLPWEPTSRDALLTAFELVEQMRRVLGATGAGSQGPDRDTELRLPLDGWIEPWGTFDPGELGIGPEPIAADRAVAAAGVPMPSPSSP